MKDISRRDAITKIATGAAGLGSVAASGELVTASQGVIADTTPARAFRGQHKPRPLPFDPAKLKGLSEKLIRSHWENNYGGAVKALSKRSRRRLRLGDLCPKTRTRVNSIITGSGILQNYGPFPEGRLFARHSWQRFAW